MEYVGVALVGVGILLMYGAYKGHDPVTAVVDVFKKTSPQVEGSVVTIPGSAVGSVPPNVQLS